MALLAQVANPVACKVGPSMSADEIALLCDLLDPNREPGRLTLIARMGADTVADQLPELVAAVRSAGHPVIWLCDPMHGNNTVTPEGRKTRYLTTVISEVSAFRRAVDWRAGWPAACTSRRPRTTCPNASPTRSRPSGVPGAGRVCATPGSTPPRPRTWLPRGRQQSGQTGN